MVTHDCLWIEAYLQPFIRSNHTEQECHIEMPRDLVKATVVPVTYTNTVAQNNSPEGKKPFVASPVVTAIYHRPGVNQHQRMKKRDRADEIA